MMNSINELQTAQQTLADQINRIADVVGTIGRDVVATALERLRAECAAAHQRMADARTEVAGALEGLLADLVATTAQLSIEGMPASPPGTPATATADTGDTSPAQPTTNAVDVAPSDTDGEPAQGKTGRKRRTRTKPVEEVSSAACGPVFDQDDEEDGVGDDGQDDPPGARSEGKEKPRSRGRRKRTEGEGETARGDEGERTGKGKGRGKRSR